MRIYLLLLQQLNATTTTKREQRGGRAQISREREAPTNIAKRWETRDGPSSLVVAVWVVG